MRILFLSTWFPYPADNGSKIRLKYLLRTLGQKHEVTLISFAYDTARPELADNLCCKTINTINVNPFVTNQTSDLRRYVSSRPVAFRPIEGMQKLVSDTLEGTRFEAIIASTEVMASYALQAHTETTKVLEEHNSMTRLMRERYNNSQGFGSSVLKWLSWQKMRRFESSLFHLFDLITAVSTPDAQAITTMMRRYQGTVEIVPNGVDCQHNRPFLFDHKREGLIYSGALTYSANLDAMRYFLSKILPLIQLSIPNVHLTITGSTKGVDLNRLPLNDAVRFTNYVQDIRAPVSQASVCVVPLRTGGGTRLKILEAMALGTPVVTTSKGAEGLTAVDGVHLLVADTPDQFAKVTVKLLSEPKLCAALSDNARRLVVENYDWQQIGNRFVQMIEQAVASKQHQ